MQVKCRDIIKVFEKMADPIIAEAWDNIGLQIGSPDFPINKIMVSLDATLPVVEEAVKNNVDLLLVHHTPMFKPLKVVRWDKPQGKIIKLLTENNICLYCAHTNLDSAIGGVNDILAQKISLQEVSVLSPSWEEKLYKIVVFVPADYEEIVRTAMTSQGAGWIGKYSDCTFQIQGTGTFRPLEGTNPFLGKKDKLEKVEEYRLETIVPQKLLQKVLNAMRGAHPYEEVAYDIYPLNNKGVSLGLGRKGFLEKEMKLEELLQAIKSSLQIKNLRYVGKPNKIIKKVALCGGSGMSLVKDALNWGADVFITGDVKYHDAQDAESLGLALIDAGHYATEKPVVAFVAEYLRKSLTEKKVEIVESQVNTDPFCFN